MHYELKDKEGKIVYKAQNFLTAQKIAKEQNLSIFNSDTQEEIK